MNKTFLLAVILLIGVLLSPVRAVDLKVNHDQIVTPNLPNISHPIVNADDNTAVHNPTNASLSEQPKIGGAEENYTKVQTNVFDSSLFNFLWCRSFNQSIFALSIKGSVFSSTNHGNDWHNFNHELEKAALGESINPHVNIDDRDREHGTERERHGHDPVRVAVGGRLDDARLRQDSLPGGQRPQVRELQVPPAPRETGACSLPQRVREAGALRVPQHPHALRRRRPVLAAHQDLRLRL